MCLKPEKKSVWLTTQKYFKVHQHDLVCCRLASPVHNVVSIPAPIFYVVNRIQSLPSSSHFHSTEPLRTVVNTHFSFIICSIQHLFFFRNSKMSYFHLLWALFVKSLNQPILFSSFFPSSTFPIHLHPTSHVSRTHYNTLRTWFFTNPSLFPRSTSWKTGSFSYFKRM